MHVLRGSVPIIGLQDKPHKAFRRRGHMHAASVQSLCPYTEGHILRQGVANLNKRRKCQQAGAKSFALSHSELPEGDPLPTEQAVTAVCLDR